MARYGGEEFVALVQGNAAGALAIAERVRLAVESLDLQDNGEAVALTVSIGVAVCALTADSPR